jgi:hypothetical protein
VTGTPLANQPWQSDRSRTFAKTHFVHGLLTVSRRLAYEWAALTFVLFFVFLCFFAAVHRAVTGEATEFSLVSLRDCGLFLLLSLLPVPLHELTHGAAMRYFGGTPRYGVGLLHFVLPYAYATSNSSYTRNHFIVILLAPCVALSVAGMLLLPWLPWLMIPLAANAAGSICDLWMTFHVLRLPADVQLLDDRSGLSVYGPAKHQGHASLEAAGGRGFLVAWLVSAGICFSGTLFACFLILPWASALLRVCGVDSFAIGAAQAPLLTFEAQSATLSLLPRGVALLAFVCGLAGLMVTVRQKPKGRARSKSDMDQGDGNLARMCVS